MFERLFLFPDEEDQMESFRNANVENKIGGFCFVYVEHLMLYH